MRMKDKERFITAHMWLYGSTRKEAATMYNVAAANAQYKYIKEIIDCFENNAKQSFYND